MSTPAPLINAEGEGIQHESSPDLDRIKQALARTDTENGVRCCFITGPAGTGKTHSIRLLINEDPKAGLLCATTGISSINLGSTTVNAALRYFDTDSLRRAYIRGGLIRRLSELACEYHTLFIDEAPMLDGDQLDIIHDALRDANDRANVRRRNPQGMGICLTGDFAQLPPVKAKWCFDAERWEGFERNTVTLTKNWRQGDGRFLDAVNAVRRGDGGLGAALLKEAGVDFAPSVNLDFPGTTILSRNDEVDRFNRVALQKLPGQSFYLDSERWIRLDEHRKKPPREWDNIPERMELKKGAFIMILSNDSPVFSFANGDTGFIEGYDDLLGCVHVRLLRNGDVVSVPMVERTLGTPFEPQGADMLDEMGLPKILPAYTQSMKRAGELRPWGVHYDMIQEEYVVGCVRFFPLRLAYASTVHKSQGLTLDRVQLDVRNAFFGQPAMAYVALSRARTAQGVRIVGNPQLLAARVKTAPEVERWL